MRRLTPRKVALRRVINRQRVFINQLRKRRLSNKHLLVRRSVDQLFAAIVKEIPPAHKHLAKFLTSQLRLCTRGKYGRRYTVTDKSLALSLYYSSPQAYRMCCRLLCLPSVSMLRLWMSKIHVSPGFCEDVFVLMKQKSSKMNESERVCALVFDRISLKTSVIYDSKTDCIVGHENFGQLGSTEKLANHALVLTARGLLTEWKQPLAYFLVSNTISADLLKVIIEQCIVKLSEAGFTTVCVICDQCATNQQMFKLFGVTPDQPCATVMDRTVNFLFDPPRLLTSLRNNLMKHDFELNGHRIKWDYIVKFHERDSRQTLKLAPKLTEKHLNLPPYAAMRVRLAAQTLSHSVAAGISTHVSFGVLPEEAVHTANFIETIDSLFDCLNSSAVKSAKQFSRPLSVNSSHWKHFENCTAMFRDLIVVGGKTAVPCINGFLMTINSVTMLFDELHKRGFKFLLTNRLNQDCIGNLFAVIRGRGGIRDNPDAHSFRLSFRRVLIKHLLRPPQTANCSNDMTEFLKQLQDADRLSKQNCARTFGFSTSTTSSTSLDVCDLQMECFTVDQSYPPSTMRLI
jgi:hypothetical protein